MIVPSVKAITVQITVQIAPKNVGLANWRVVNTLKFVLDTLISAVNTWFAFIFVPVNLNDDIQMDEIFRKYKKILENKHYYYKPWRSEFRPRRKSKQPKKSSSKSPQKRRKSKNKSKNKRSAKPRSR